MRLPRPDFQVNILQHCSISNGYSQTFYYQHGLLSFKNNGYPYDFTIFDAGFIFTPVTACAANSTGEEGDGSLFPRLD
jgi:hypothetical protein